MRIGFDITILYIARAGILYYNINLLRQLVTLAPADEFTFVDYVPVRQSLPLAAPIDDLLSPRVQWKVIDGPPHRKAIRWQRLNFTGGRFFAQQVDAVLVGQAEDLGLLLRLGGRRDRERSRGRGEGSPGSRRAAQ